MFNGILTEQPLGLQGKTRERLLSATIHFLINKGYTGTGIRDIAKACDIAESSFYHHFPSKDNIIEEILKRIMNYSQNEFFPLVQGNQIPIEKRISTFAASLKLFLEEREDLILVCQLAPELLNIKFEFRALIQSYMQSWIDIFNSLFKPLMSAEKAQYHAEQMVAQLMGAVLLVKTFNDPIYIERFCDDLRNLIH